MKWKEVVLSGVKMKVKSKKYIEREQLTAWRLICLNRDDFKCQVCKKKPDKPHVHHIIPTQFKELMYDVMNGICLCFNHHKVGKYSPHQNALWFYEWLKNEKPEQFKYLRDKMK